VIAALPRARDRRAGWRERARGLRGRVATTPGRLQLLFWLLAAGAVLLGASGAAAVLETGRAVDGLGMSAGPAVLDARKLHLELADADRFAADEILIGPIAVSSPRPRYESDLKVATDDLETMAGRTTSAASAGLLQILQEQLLEYAGLIEQARAISRLGLPLGAAYLRAASDLMHRPAGILARVDALGALGDQEMSRDDEALLLAAIALAGYGAIAASLLVLLWRTQAFLRRRFRRRHNPMLLVATGLVILVSGAMAVTVTEARVALGSARSDAYERLSDMWRAREVAYDADGSKTLVLVAPNGASAQRAFVAAMRQLVDVQLDTPGDSPADQKAAGIGAADVADALNGGRVRFGGLLADELQHATYQGERKAALAALAAYQHFVQVAAKMDNQLQDIGFGTAVSTVTSDGPDQLPSAFLDLDSRLQEVVAIDQQRFDETMRQASLVHDLDVTVPLVAIAIGVLAYLGIRPRVVEYRT
jgi:hypothetical protein